MRRTAALLLVLAGCHGATLDVTLSSSPITDEDPFAGADALELRWPTQTIRVGYERGATLHLSPPAADGTQLEIAVISAGTVVAVGRTPRLPKSARTATAYVGRLNRFAATASRSANLPRFGATATLLGDGRVLIAGGATRGSPGLPDAASISAALELYDPATSTFTVVPSTGTSERIYHAAVALPDGGALLVGGLGKFGALDEIVRVQATGASVVGKLPAPRFGAAAAPLPDGRLLLVGGYSAPDGMGGGTLATDAVAVDATVNVTAVALPSPRAFAVATPLSGGILISGGVDALGPRSDALVYDATAQAFAAPSPSAARAQMLSPRVGHSATLLPDGRVFVYGGNDGRASVAVPELFSPTAGGFVDLPPFNLNAREHHGAVTTPDGTLLLVGGERSPQRMAAPSPVRELLYYADSTLSAATGATAARADADLLLLGDGSVLWLGGAVDDPRTLAGGAQILVPCFNRCAVAGAASAP